MRSNLWREQIAKLMLDEKTNCFNIRSSFLSAPDILSSPVSSKSRWSRSKLFVDTSLTAWTKLGRITPYQKTEIYERFKQMKRLTANNCLTISVHLGTLRTPTSLDRFRALLNRF